MRTTVTSRHFKATQKLKDYASKEVQRLKKYFDNIIDCEVVLAYDVRQNKTAEISIRVKGDRMMASETSEDFYKSIDLAVNKLEKQVQRHKDRLKRKH